jgi:branched-chain amino acid transport system permease protein
MADKLIEFFQQLLNGLSQGSIYALVAIGYTMVFGVLRFINFAHGDVYMLGAFAGLGAWSGLGDRIAGALSLAFIPAWGGSHVQQLLQHAIGTGFSGLGMKPSIGSMLVVILLAMMLCACIGVVIEKLCYRPLRERPKLTVLITAIGVSLFLENAGQLVLGADPKSFPEIITDRAIQIPDSWGKISALTVTLSQVIVFGVTLLLLFVLRYIVMKTKMGMAMRALSFNPVAASLMGINNDVVISFTFGLGSALAGAAGILISIQQPEIDPLMGINAGLKAFVAAVLGGIGNVPGAALGGILIGVLEALVVGYVDPTYRDAIVFGVLILILIFKPTGLLGIPEREKV